MTRIKLKYIHEFRDRWGRMRRYFRRKGFARVALPGLPGSPDFMDAYRDALAGVPAATGRDYKPRTFGDLVTRYYGAAEFANLKPSSKRLYRFVLSKHVERDGHRMATDLPVEKARKIVEEIAATPGMANLSRAVLVAVFEFAIDLGWRLDNPFKRVPAYKLGTRHTWTDEQLDAYRARWSLGTRERLAFAVLLYSGQRVSDAVKLKRSDVFALKQQKTGTPLTIPAHPALARAVKAGPSNGIYIIGDPRGRPIIARSLTRLISRAAAAAGLPKECTAHGLRKAIQRILAERGATTKQLQAISGHKSLRESERYTAEANQGLLAATAIALLPDESETGGG